MCLFQQGECPSRGNLISEHCDLAKPRPVDSSVLGCSVILDPDFVTPRTLFAAPLCKLLLHYRHCLSCLHRLGCATVPHHSALTRAEHTLHNQISPITTLSISTCFIYNKIYHKYKSSTHQLSSSPIMTISSLSTGFIKTSTISASINHQIIIQPTRFL